MLKRLIMVLLAISMLALLSPAPARAGCLIDLTPYGLPGCCLTILAGGSCIYCPCTSYSVSGEPTTPDQCTWWYPGGAQLWAVVKDLLKEDTKDCEGEGCAEVLATVVGSVDRKGEPVLNPLDPDAFSEWYVTCCNKSEYNRRTGACDPQSSGNPGVDTVRSISNAALIDNLRKHVSRTTVDVEPQFCPDSFPYQEAHLKNGNGVGCICPRGWDEVSNGRWLCCHERDAAGECTSYDSNGGVSVDDFAVVVHLELDDPNHEEFDKQEFKGSAYSILFDEESPYYSPDQYPDGFCNYLYSEFKKSQK